MSVRSAIYCLLFAFVAFATACKKDHRVLDSSVQPAEDGLNTSALDGLPVYMHTVKHDPVVSFNNSLKYLGSNNDPVFGRTDIGLYVNFNKATEGGPPVTVTLTAAHIMLEVDNNGFAGNPAASLSFSVYPVNAALSATTAYYTSNDSLHDQQVLFTASSVSTTTSNNKTTLRIPMDTAYARQMLQSVGSADFSTKYKGFYIRASADGGEGVIYKCNLHDDSSGVFLRYKSDTSVVSFRLNFSASGSVKFNTLMYDDTNANPLLKSQLQGDTAGGGQNVFLKGMGISRARVYIPFLKNYGDTFKVAVNRAELVLPVDPSFAAGAGYSPPSSLALLPVNDEGSITLALDQQNATDNIRYDGKYDKENNLYVFNIARHAQALLKGERRNNGFYLVVAQSDGVITLFQRDNFVERVVLTGHNKSGLRPSFKLNYSVIKQN